MNIDEIFARLSSLAGVSSDAALAKELQVTPQAIANSRKRGAVPYEKICAYARRESLSLDYLLFGDESSQSDAQLEIDDEIAEEVIRDLRIQAKPLFKSSSTVPAIRFFSSVYNQVCHLRSSSDRALSIRKAIGRELLSSQQDFLDSVDQIPADELPQEQREILKDSTQKGIDKIKDKYGLANNEATRNVNQNFNAEVGQAAGGNIHNHGSKDK